MILNAALDYFSSCVFNQGWSKIIQDSSPPGTCLDTPGIDNIGFINNNGS